MHCLLRCMLQYHGTAVCLPHSFFALWSRHGRGSRNPGSCSGYSTLINLTHTPLGPSSRRGGVGSAGPRDRQKMHSADEQERARERTTNGNRRLPRRRTPKHINNKRNTAVVTFWNDEIFFDSMHIFKNKENSSREGMRLLGNYPGPFRFER